MTPNTTSTFRFTTKPVLIVTVKTRINRLGVEFETICTHINHNYFAIQSDDRIILTKLNIDSNRKWDYNEPFEAVDNLIEKLEAVIELQTREWTKDAA